MTRRANDNAKALDAFIAAKTEIDAMLERLAALSADHFETHPDEINWGHVGTLNHYRAKLREITDMAFHEGEHADRDEALPVPPADWRARPRRRARIPRAPIRETTMTKLSDTQALILSAAAQRPEHIALPLPESLRGGAAAKVVGAMLGKGFLEEVDADLRKGEPVWRETGDGHGVTLVATDAGLAAIGVEPESGDSAPTGADAAQSAEDPQDAPAEPDPAPKARTPRTGTKQAKLIAMLRAEGGATIDEIVAETGWQPHYADARIMPM
jgi:hypothetical protein